MTKPAINYGQVEIHAFNNAVSAGEIHYEEAAVRQAVQLYERAVATLSVVRQKLQKLENATGFGGFQTGKELKIGFNKKATDGAQVISELIDGAMQLQECYLRAGGLIEEADHLNSQRIKLLESSEAGTNW